MNSEQAYSPGEIGLGKLVDFDKGDFVGRRALAGRAPARVARARRLVGLELDWPDIDAMYNAQGLPPTAPAVVDRSAVPRVRRGRPPGRPDHEPRLEPDPQEADRPCVRAARLRAAGHAAPGRVDGRGAAAAGSARRSSSCRSWTCPASASSASRPAERPGAGPAADCASGERNRRRAGLDPSVRCIGCKVSTELAATGPVRAPDEQNRRAQPTNLVACAHLMHISRGARYPRFVVLIADGGGGRPSTQLAGAASSRPARGSRRSTTDEYHWPTTE